MSDPKRLVIDLAADGSVGISEDEWRKLREWTRRTGVSVSVSVTRIEVRAVDNTTAGDECQQLAPAAPEEIYASSLTAENHYRSKIEALGRKIARQQDTPAAPDEIINGKRGFVVSLSLKCGTCGHVGHEAYLRWCSACREAICPKCVPAGEPGQDRSCWVKCKRCIAENRETFAEAAGRQMAEDLERRAVAPPAESRPVRRTYEASMSNPHATFLRAICARPDIDLPRLVYADALEKGDEFPPDAERAEFIRVQCTIARFPPTYCSSHDRRNGIMIDLRTPCTCKLCALRRRERELLLTQQHWHHWHDFDELGFCKHLDNFNPDDRGERDIGLVFRRGFVESITCSWSDFRTHADAIRAATPLRRAKLTTAQLWENGRTKFACTERWGVYTHADFPGIEFELSP